MVSWLMLLKMIVSYFDIYAQYINTLLRQNAEFLNVTYFYSND